ncbi:MAG: hypothetical protein M1829_001889 [Trizodia sp. TS-e1964]|nr:MAG: hypothetical protein M1829_001889 [Trizodia sp. TS-e1964]
MPGNSDQKAPMPGNAFAQKAWANRSLVKAEEKSETGEKGDKIEKAKGEASKNADMHSHKHEAAKPNPLFSGLNKPLPTHPGEGKKSTVAMIDEALTPLIKAQQAADADRIVAKNPEAFVNPQEFNVSWTDTPPPLRPRSKKRPVYDFSKTNAKVAESSAGPSTPIGQLSGPGSGDNGKKAGPSKGPSPSLAAFSGWSVSSLSKHSDGNESSARNDGMILGQGGMSPSTTGSYGRQGKGKLAISPRVESMAGIISEAAEEHLTLRAISKASSNIDGMVYPLSLSYSFICDVPDEI